MKERPILFNSEMVQAILSGRKTQTRRVIQSPARTMQANNINCISYREPGDKWYQDYVFSMRDRSGAWQDYTKEQFLAKCPLGKPGDQLWVRETFATLACGSYEPEKPSLTGTYQEVRYLATDRLAHCDAGVRGYNWRPSIHMPRWASRINLLITGIRVERLDDISQHDARCEGIVDHHNVGQEKYLFSRLWRDIYGEESWSDNPWVWAIEFERVAPAGEQP